MVGCNPRGSLLVGKLCVVWPQSREALGMPGLLRKALPYCLPDGIIAFRKGAVRLGLEMGMWPDQGDGRGFPKSIFCQILEVKLTYAAPCLLCLNMVCLIRAVAAILLYEVKVA